MQGVDHDFLDLARVAQGDDHPVIAWRATTCGFPAIAHVDAAARVEDVAHAAEVFVGTGQGTTAIERGSQVDLFVVAHRRPVAERHAVHTQTGHAAIRVDVEAQVAERLVVVDLVEVMAVALQLHGRQHFDPLGVVIGLAGSQEAAFQGSRWREVAGEE